MSTLGKIFSAVQTAARYMAGYGPSSEMRVTYLDAYKGDGLNIAQDTRTTYRLASYPKLNGEFGMRMIVEDERFQQAFVESGASMGVAYYIPRKEIHLGALSKDAMEKLFADFENGKYIFDLIPNTSYAPLLEFIAKHEIFKGFCMANDENATLYKPADPVAYIQNLHSNGKNVTPLFELT